MDAIVKVVFDWCRAKDLGESVTAIFFDFAKAFDLVDHVLLLRKLRDKIKLPEWLISWIAAYISDRQQRVRHNGIESEWKKVLAGVIQGSVLGPILFILFISDINEYIPDTGDFEKYADDILSYIIGEAATTSLPQLVAEGVQRWCQDNNMKLNASKCQVLHIKGRHDIGAAPNIALNGQQLRQVESYKYLGVHLNTTFDWSQQWEHISSKISTVPFLLKQLKQLNFRENILINVYRSLVISHLNYSSTILSSANSNVIQEIASFQMRCLRIINIDQQRATKQYQLIDVQEQLELISRKVVTKILSNRDHLLTIFLLKGESAHCTRASARSEFSVPRASSRLMSENAVVKWLYTSGRSTPAAATSLPPNVPAKPIPTRVPCPNNCGNNFTVRGMSKHLASCISKMQSLKQ